MSSSETAVRAAKRLNYQERPITLTNRFETTDKRTEVTDDAFHDVINWGWSPGSSCVSRCPEVALGRAHHQLGRSATH